MTTPTFSGLPDDRTSPSAREAALSSEVERLRRRLDAVEAGSGRGGAHLRRILDSAVDFAIVATDLGGLVTQWNDGARRMLGWSEHEMLGHPVDRFFTPEDVAAGRVATEMRNALETGRGNDERWHQRKGGERFWAAGEMTVLRDEDGTPVGFVKVLRDRTEQRRAEERQRADAEFMRSVFASTSDCIKVLDLDGNIVFMSEGGQRVMEVGDFNAIQGCPWPDFWQGPGREKALAALATARAGGVGRFQGPADTVAGTPRHWDVQVTAILDARGRPEKLLSISRDITTLMRSEAAVRESEGYWRSLFEKLHEGLIVGEVVRDAHGRVTDWRYLDVNPAWGNLVAIAPKAAVGRTVRNLFPGIEQAWVDEMATVVDTGRPATFTREVGSLGRWYDGRVFALGRDRFAALFLEVTERRWREERQAALLRLGDLLRDTEGLADTSYAAAEIMGRTLGAMRAGYGTVGEDGGVFVVERDWAAPGGTSLAGSHALRDFGRYVDDLHRGLAVVVDDIEHDPRTASGAEALRRLGVRALVNLPIVERGRLVAVLYVNRPSAHAWTAEEVSFVREVAARTRAEAERRRAEGALRVLTASLEHQVEERTDERNRVWSSTNDLMATAGLDGYLREVNPAWERALGWDGRTLLGRPFADLIDPADHTETRSVVDRLARGETVTGFVDRLRTRKGGLRTVMWDATPDGNLFYIVGRDITEQRQTEEALRQSQKMEAVGQLTGGLAHDFNNLLTGISGSLDLLQKRVAQGRIDDLDRYLVAAQGAAKRAAALTHRLLAFSRRQTLDPKPTDVRKLVGGMIDLIRRTVGPEITVETVDMAGLWTALVDPSQLENALLNLCINARDAMPDGGRITIETANRWMDERTAQERDVAPGPYLSLCVSDTGTGMPPDVMARAFDPFFTTKPLGQGTGLGLSMIYGFARQSGGHVLIRSELGQGTTLCIDLPRHDGAEARAEAAADRREAPRAEAGETVLVVDDEPTVRMLVGDVLSDLGYGAIEAGDGPSGLKVLEAGTRVDLLVTDVGLPGGMNGRQVADAARVLRPELKVLFITGYAENAVVGNGHLDPGMAVLTKPFAMDDLAAKIRTLIAG